MQYANDTNVRKINVKEKRKNKTKQDKTQKPYKILSLLVSSYNMIISLQSLF